MSLEQRCLQPFHYHSLKAMRVRQGTDIPALQITAAATSTGSRARPTGRQRDTGTEQASSYTESALLKLVTQEGQDWGVTCLAHASDSHTAGSTQCAWETPSKVSVGTMKLSFQHWYAALENFFT